MNCSKVLVKNFWDIDGVWKGKYAKYFEECARSQAGSSTSDDPQVTATLWNNDWKESIAETLIWGSTDPESGTWCKSLPFIGPSQLDMETGEYIESQNGLAIAFYQRFFDFMNNYPLAKQSFKGHYNVI